MDIEKLVMLRNHVNSIEGKLLINYLSDYITENACLKREPAEIKGMCELLQQVKIIPELVEQRK